MTERKFVAARFHVLHNCQEPIESMELYLVQIDAHRHFSFGTWHSRQHLFVGVGSGEQLGWGEEVADLNRPDFDPMEWGNLLQQLKGLSIGSAFAWLNHNEDTLPSRLREMTEMALIDLVGKIRGITAHQLLGLYNTAAVPGLYCLLENDPSVLKTKAEQAKSKGFTTHMKLKLFGNKQLDNQLIEAVRQVYGTDAYIVGDVNYGYRVQEAEDLGELAYTLTALANTGLSACEDPAEMKIAQWEQLQRMVKPLDLIPDVLLRPAKLAIMTVKPQMGNIFNIHPGAMGSITDAILLAEKIQSFGGRIMIGDNSLIGPACTVWQQIAIGLGVCWVEAIEKPDELPQFAEWTQRRATFLGPNGLVSLASSEFPASRNSFGFGLYMDKELLQRSCKIYVRVF